MRSPYFFTKTKAAANIVVHDEYPGHRMTFSAWQILRSFKFTVSCPEFAGVDLNVFRHLEEVFRMMINHAAKCANAQRGVGGGTAVDVEWSMGDTVAALRVFPRSVKYIITLTRDELGNVTIDSPQMKFSDIPSMNQAMKVVGQVVHVAMDMMGR